jgi:hypothetical protein
MPSTPEFMFVSGVIQKNITKNSEECYLDDVKQFIIPLEENLKDEVTVAENEVNSNTVITYFGFQSADTAMLILLLSIQIYLGNKLKVTRDQLYEVGCKSSFTSKVGALLDYFFPDGPEMYSLSGKSKYAGKALEKISEHTKENMKSKLSPST